MARMSMNITPTLIRWSRRSNRRRAVELAVLLLPWTIAGVAASLAVQQRFGTQAAEGVAAGVIVSAVTAGLYGYRRLRRDAMSTAHEVDRAHGTSDLLA